MENSWTERRLGDFAKRKKIINVSGDDLPPLSITKDNGVVLQSSKYKKRIATDPHKYVVVDRGDFAFDPMSLYYGALGLVKRQGQGLISPDYVSFTVDSSVDPSFLEYLLRSKNMVQRYESVAELGNKFGKRRRVYWSVFENLTVKMPSLAEQKKIAQVLTSVDDAVDASRQVLDRLEIARRALMRELFAYGLPSRAAQAKSAPGNWTLTRLSEVGTWMSGGTPSKAEQTLWAGTIPWVSPKDMKVTRLGDALDHVSEEAIGNGTRLAPTGTIFLVVRGMILAHSFPVAIAMRPMAFNQDIKAVTPSQDFDGDYLLYWLISQREKVLSLVADSSHGTKRVPSESFFSLVVPTPPLDEQRQIAASITSAERAIEDNKKALHKLLGLRAALHCSLLSGEVRVPLEQEAA